MRKSFSIAFIVILSLGLVCTRPFDIYADTISSSNVIGVEPRILDYNVSVNPQSQTINGTTYAAVDYVIEFIVKLDSYYYGEITGDLSFYWDSYIISNNTATPQRNNTTINNTTYYVNGNQFIIPYTLRCFQIVNISHEDLFDPYYQITFSIDSSDVVNYDILSNYKQYNIPVESLPWVTACFGYGLIPETFNRFYYYSLPVFKVNRLQTIFQRWTSGSTNGTDVDLYFYSTAVCTSTAQLSNYFQILNADSYSLVDMTYYMETAYGALRYYHINLHVNAGNTPTLVVRWLNNNSDNFFIPVCVTTSTSKYNFSTDFALLFGFSNQLLDDLHIIANGTQQSNASSSNLEDMNDDYDDVSQQVFGLENNFSTGFDSSMQNVPTTFNFGTQFGNKFLATATWVRNQFDNMTTNTPFGALITFSLVLGLALLIVGRRLL